VRRPTTARRGIAAAALALALGLTLAACSGDSEDDPSPSPSASSTADAADDAEQTAVAAIKLEGEPGAEPKVTLPSTPFTVSSVIVKVLEPGTGDTIEDGALLSVRSVMIAGADGSVAASTYTGAPENVILSEDVGILHETLVGEKVGVRFAMAIPPQSADNPAVYVRVGEIVDVLPSQAVGEPVPPVAGLPTVTLDADGKPTVTPATGPAPTTLVAQPLITGTGAPVTAEQTLTVQYDLSLWDGTPVRSTWEDGKPVQFALSGVIPGWQEGLVGQPVGSQVLLVVPPDKGYGSKASDTIPANSTLVYVVDILAAG